MPKIPQYTAKRNITAREAAPRQNEAAQAFGGQRKILGTLTDITQKLSDANDVMEYTEAKGRHQTSIADIELRAAEDPNFNNSEQYFKELKKSKAKSLAGISNAQVKDKAALEMDFGNQMSSIKIGHNFQTKQLAAGRFRLHESVEALQNRKIQSSGAEAAQYGAEIDKLLALNIETGIITAKEGKALLQKSNKSAAAYDATVTPEKFLSNGSEYYGIPKDEYKKLAKTAKDTAARDDKVAIENMEKIQNQNEVDLTMQLANQEIDRLSVSDVTKQIQNGQITQEFGSAYIRVLTSAKHIDRNKKVERSGFSKYAQELFSSEDEAGTKAALIRMLDGAAEGDLNEEQLGVLLKVANKAGGNKGWISGVLSSMAGIAAKATLLSSSKMSYSFFEYMNQGEEVDAARDKAVTDEQIRANPNRTKYVIDKLYPTAMGEMRVKEFNKTTGDPIWERP